MKILRVLAVIITAFLAITLKAQNNIELIPAANKNIAGNQTGTSGISFPMSASLLYGMPFELSFDVSLTGTTSDTAPSCNQWGSAILTTGSSPFVTPTNGIQVYLRCKGNSSGAYLVITANGQAFNFTNIPYNADKFNVHLIQSNGQLTMEVTNNATSTGVVDTERKVVRYTKSMMFNSMDRLSYAMPNDMNVSNLSLTVRTEDIKNYITNIMPHGVGYLTQEARDYICENIDGENGLAVYQSFIAATVLDASGNFGQINGKRSYQLPEIGKVYTIRGVCQDNAYYLMREDDAERQNPYFTLTSTKPNLNDQVQVFKYLWAPRPKSAEDKIALYHATGTGQYLAHNGLSASGTALTSAQEWTLSNGTEAGRMSLWSQNIRSGGRYIVTKKDGSVIGDWPSNAGGVYSKRQNDNTWSTDFIFEEVPFLSAYELIVTGPSGFDATGITVRYREKKEGTTEYYTGENEGVVADITAGGLIFIKKDYEESNSAWRLSISDFTPEEKTGYVAVVTLGSGVVKVEYTQFAALKGKAEAEIKAAQDRLTNFAAGALYSQAAIDAAKSGIAEAQELFAPQSGTSDPQAACAKLEQTMETFYMTIDGRYVVIENGTSTNEKFLSTTGNTNLSTKTKATDATGNYFGVYQLHYISGGAYQLRNAYYDNYLGQTTSASSVNSASNTVASRWRGTYSFELKKTDNSEDAYNIVCTNGVNGSLLGVGTNNAIAKNATTASTDATNLWDIRLVDVKTYANAYQAAISQASFDNVIGHAPSTVVKDAFVAAISACPDRASNPTTEQETTLSLAVNYYIDNKDDINKPRNGQFVTFQNRATTTKYLRENLYEMQPTTTLDLGCVWETVVVGDKYYFKNAKSGMYMGKVTQSAIGRLTIKNEGANKQEIDIVAAPGRGDGTGFVALHEMGTNNSYSYIHHASSGRDDIVGWTSTTEASHWTINAVTDDDLISYLQTATTNVKSILNTDISNYNSLQGAPGNYEKSDDAKSAATTAASAEWPTSPTKEQALAAYTSAVTAFNAFTNAGEPIYNNEMFLIKTSIQLNDQNGQHPAKYFVTQALDDNNGNENGGSLTNGIEQKDEDDFYLFTLWQLVQDGEYYKLYNFYTGHYLSKDISLSNNHNNRYGLTTNPNDAASFIIKPEHGCFVSFHRSDYEEMNDGYLNMITTPAGSRTMFGLARNNIVKNAEVGRMLFELEPSTTKHYEKCLASMLNYEIGDGVGKYKDVSGNYATERDKVKALLDATEKPADYANQLQIEAKTFAPILAGLRINLPEAGHYYRLYSLVTTGEGDGKTVTRYYLSNASSNNSPSIIQNTGGDNIKPNVPSVYYYDGSRLLSYGNGFYLGNGTPWVMGGVGQYNEFDFANSGYKNKGCYSIKPRGRSYLYNYNNTQLNGWSSAFNERCEWYLEEVTELPLAVSAAGYSTLISGRTHKIPSGVKCYVAESASTQGGLSTGSIILQSITDGILPDNVPVLIKAAQGTYYFTEPENDEIGATYDSNLFMGQLETIYSGYEASNHKQYTLQKPSGKSTGFYLYTGNTLAGFKIYLPVETVEQSTGSRPNGVSFFFTDDTVSTDIDDITYQNKIDNALYDLSGRKVSTPQRGLYIMNGKKILINH